MPHVRYGGLDGQDFELMSSKTFLAVRTRSGRSLLAGPVARPESAFLDEFALEFSIPEAGVEIFRRTVGSRSTTVDSTKKALTQFQDTRFAGSVLVSKQSEEPIIYTENLFIKFGDEQDQESCLAVLGGVGLTVKRPVAYSRNAFFVGAPEGIGQRVFELALDLLRRDGVELCHPELVRRKGRRQVFDQQWHLKSTTFNNNPVSASANVEAAHTVTSGEGVVIAIIDDGVDIDHEEFSSAGKIVAPRDVGVGVEDPRPRFSNDDHGTACAGVACGDGRFGASGVAPRARLMPIRNVTALGSQAEADAIAWAADNGADVISCSWGPRDGRWFDPSDPVHHAFAPLPDSSRLAIDYAVNTGRDGKGCIIMWAAGNGNEDVENDGYASYGNVLAIAACNDRGSRSIYSDMGASIFCAFPSNDFEFASENHPAPLTSGIWTVDRHGGAGYNPGSTQHGDVLGHYTNSFGGTSSAAPGAAGVAALILSVSPDLRWDQVADVLRRSCDQVDPQNGQYVNGRSPLYGFGRLNAETAVRLARPQRPSDSVVLTGNFHMPINDFRTAAVQLSVADSRSLANVQVSVDIRHTFIGDLTVTLVPPTPRGGAPIVLHEREGRGTHNIRRTYDTILVPDLAELIGKNATGMWTLEVSDDAFRDQGEIRQFGLELEFAGGDSRASREQKSAPARSARDKTPSRKKRKAGKKKKSGDTRR